MKKGILILLSFIFFISIYAQKEQLTPAQSEGLKEGKSNFCAGIRIGFSCSQITSDGLPFQGYNKFGAFAGPFVNFPITKNGKWFIQPELNFIMKGCKHVPKFDEYGNIVGSVIHKYVLQLMYGEIPLLVKWKIIKGFELELGPAFGVLFKNTDVEKVDNEPNIGATSFFRFEFAGIIGVNYCFDKHWGASLQYEGSLLPVRKPRAEHWLYVTSGQHNQSFCFSVYYQF
jgi:hypothetical protein